MNACVLTSTISDAGATASHALGSPLLVPATLGTAAIHVDVASPDWAEFDQIQIFVNNVPSCTTTSPNFVGSTKKLCPPVANYTLNKGTDFTVTSVPVNGSTRLEAHVVKTLSGVSLPAGDAWVVVIVKGTDGVSKPLFPMAPVSIFRRACSGDPCRSCATPGDCTPFFAGTCVNQNLTVADLSDGNLGQCGVTSLAIANPLFIDRDGDGFYKGLSVP